MWNLLLPTITPIIDKLVDLIPNKNERERAKEAFQLEMSRAVNEAAASQVEVNKIEAAHTSIFVAGWRPSIGWVCSIALLWTYIIYPLISWFYLYHGMPVESIPKLDTDNLFELVFCLLGLGGMRTFEKLKGVAR